MQQVVKKHITVGQTVNATFTGQTGRNVANYQITNSGEENVSYELSISNDKLIIAVTGLSATDAPLYQGDTPQYSEKLHVVYLGDVPGQADEPVGDVWYNCINVNPLYTASASATDSAVVTPLTTTLYADQGAESVEGWKYSNATGTDLVVSFGTSEGTPYVTTSVGDASEKAVFDDSIMMPYADKAKNYLKVCRFVRTVESTDDYFVTNPLTAGASEVQHDLLGLSAGGEFDADNYTIEYVDSAADYVEATLYQKADDDVEIGIAVTGLQATTDNVTLVIKYTYHGVSVPVRTLTLKVNAS